LFIATGFADCRFFARRVGILNARFDMAAHGAIHVPARFARDWAGLQDGFLQNAHSTFNSTQGHARFVAPLQRSPNRLYGVRMVERGTTTGTG
jgi:hypothetical protein